MENNEFYIKFVLKKLSYKKLCIKNRKCYYFNDIIKFEDFDFGNILLDEK